VSDGTIINSNYLLTWDEVPFENLWELRLLSRYVTIEIYDAIYVTPTRKVVSRQHGGTAWASFQARTELRCWNKHRSEEWSRNINLKVIV
jgi:hypothetical protein